MNNKVLEIWNSLEAAREIGLVKRLYSNDIPYNLYCTFDYPNKGFGIALSYPQTIHFNLQPFEQYAELKVAIYLDYSFKDSNLLSVQITNISDKDIFSCLCENLIAKIARQSDIVKAVTTFGNTLLRWQKLFDRKHSTGLSKEEQQGLYGELYFLNKCLTANLLPFYDLVGFYIGVDKSLRDFQGENWAVEVKTTSTNNPQELTINGERQLDDTMIDYLYLYHCSVEVSASNGETLMDIIEKIRNKLREDAASIALFNSKLFEAGYYEENSSLYKSRCYKIRSENFYRVHNNFPRIKEKDLLPGVGNVKYGIVIADCDSYLDSEDKVLLNCFRHD